MKWILGLLFVALLLVIYDIGYQCGKIYQLNQITKEVTTFGKQRFEIDKFAKDMEKIGYICQDPKAKERVWIKK
jgi:hypothetical protein